MNNNLDFYKWFETIASKLGNREISFRNFFKYLDAQPTPIIIVETGCLRNLDNFADGQSTLLFDKYTLSRGKGSLIHEYAMLSGARLVFSHYQTAWNNFNKE